MTPLPGGLKGVEGGKKKKKKKKRRLGRRDSRAGRLPGAHTLRITGRKGVASQVPPVMSRGFITL